MGWGACGDFWDSIGNINEIIPNLKKNKVKKKEKKRNTAWILNPTKIK